MKASVGRRLRMESCENSLSGGENTLIKQDKILVTSVSSKHGIDLAKFFVLLPGVVDRSEFTSEYSLLLVVHI